MCVCVHALCHCAVKYLMECDLYINIAAIVRHVPFLHVFGQKLDNNFIFGGVYNTLCTIYVCMYVMYACT